METAPERLGGIFQQTASDAMTTPPKTPQSNGCSSEAEPPKLPETGLPPGFEDLRDDLIGPKFIDALQDVRKSKRWPIYLFGDSGRGKTYAMAWSYRFAKRGGFAVEWHDISQLVRAINRCRSSDTRATQYCGSDVFEGRLFERIKGANLVCFDDLGLRGATDAMYDVLYELVSLRRGKPTIYTSNLNAKKLRDTYDSRIASRVLEGTWIEMTGEDRRIAKAVHVKV